MDAMKFFREFCLRICGSLDIEKALCQCLLYLKGVIPIDELALLVYDQKHGALEIVAAADAGGGKAYSSKVGLPAGIRRELEHAFSHPRARVTEDAFKDSIAGKVASALEWPESSLLVERLILDKKLLGALYARADGKGRYTEEHEKLWNLINEPAAIALANSRRYRELEELNSALSDESRYYQAELRKISGEEIVGADFGLKDVMKKVRQVAPLPSPVLLLGETGTGKEVIASAIHNLSPRNKGPFIKVNCGGIPDSLVDSELFGHEKGAFTGALSQHKGRFERAHGGTIFLDEVGELSAEAQVKLLRVLQEKTLERVGGSSPVQVDIRIISATHRDLERLAAQNHFREDLLFRLKVFPIVIPPLRERRLDIPLLVHHFMKKKWRELGLHRVPSLAEGEMERLIAYPWPGNVRELENTIERSLILAEGRPLQFDQLIPSATGEQEVASLSEMEARHIRKALEKTGGKVEGKGGAAELLGIHPGTLRHRMRKLGVPFGRKAK